MASWRGIEIPKGGILREEIELMTRGRKNLTICHGCAYMAQYAECACGAQLNSGACTCWQKMPYAFVTVCDQLPESDAIPTCDACGIARLPGEFYRAEVMRDPQYFLLMWQEIPGNVHSGDPQPVTSRKEALKRIKEFQRNIGGADVAGTLLPIDDLGDVLWVLERGPKGGWYWG